MVVARELSSNRAHRTSRFSSWFLMLLILLLKNTPPCTSSGQHIMVDTNEMRFDSQFRNERTKREARAQHDHLAPSIRIPASQRKRHLKHQGLAHDFSSWLHGYFDEPVKYWSLQEWIMFFLLIFMGLCLLRCICGVLRGLVDWFCNCCCGYRRTTTGYYYQRPPAYNPAYTRSYYGTTAPPQSNDCTCCDLLAAACCINCCTNGGNGTACDALCGLCCFEVCCRGGRDITRASAVNPSYGAIVV